MEDVQQMSVRSYLDKTVVPVVMQAMSEVARERPQYPIEFIIKYLRENNPEGGTAATHGISGTRH